MKKHKRDLRAAQGMQEPRPRPEEMSRWEKQQPEPVQMKDEMQTSAGLRMQAARARAGLGLDGGPPVGVFKRGKMTDEKD